MLSQKREVTAHDTVATSSAKNSSQHLSPQLRIAIQGPKMKSAAPQEAGDPKDKPCLLCTMEQKSRFWKAVKSLALLRLFRSTNRRVQRLHTVAVRCWRSLTAQGLPGATSLLPRECHHLPEPEEDVGSPETSSTSSTADTPMEPETSTESAATEAKQDSLETLPQRFHMPAPKVLCRPSAQRWVKPCCTRSCGESLERTLTIRYPR
ncbi:TP53-target gene 5 protein [Coturnix japonica]|uniref:TP53-target gene 5 protein n=1 Tax=Coturnix japonica TaxID=93934 RepID=UPI0007772387|nr:TP53-target gene 5 protein [Coturnix japonica]XP_032304516.1 TP53-target gene 5 protein [Coturnix japonica]XP_032304518.1 TP53-target gene 5 protein [Coturnix japonica]